MSGLIVFVDTKIGIIGLIMMAKSGKKMINGIHVFQNMMLVVKKKHLKIIGKTIRIKLII